MDEKTETKKDGKELINSLPNKVFEDIGFIYLKFFRFYPSFELIEKRVPLGFFVGGVNKLKFLDECGLHATLEEIPIEIDDYVVFLSKLFNGFKVEDYQYNSESGHPDFKLSTNKFKFYIELKKDGDSIRQQQVSWVAKNKQEVWFMFVNDKIGGID